MNPFGNPVHTIEINVRNEAVVSEGTVAIETDQMIANPNSVGVSWEIKYDHYYDDDYFLTLNDASSEYVVYDQIEESQYKQNGNGYLTTNFTLPQNAASAANTPLGIETYKIAQCRGEGIAGWEGISNKRVIKLANDNYRIQFDYRFVTWWGYNRISATKIRGIIEQTATLYAARQIDFTISANTVEASEMEFTYKSTVPLLGGAQGKNYEIASNEFLQTDERTSPNQRKSAIVSNEIFDKFDTDRTLVSFVLLNCEKYVVGNEERYLRAEDLIYIKDENGEFLSDDDLATGEQTPSVFEIIKTRPIWNGSFEMEVTCRKVDMTT